MKGLEKLIHDLAIHSCPGECGLYQKEQPCKLFTEDKTVCEMLPICTACWNEAIEKDVPEEKEVRVKNIPFYEEKDINGHF